MNKTLFNKIAALQYGAVIESYFIALPSYPTKGAFESKKSTSILTINIDTKKCTVEGKNELYGKHLIDYTKDTLYIAQSPFDCIAIKCVDNEINVVAAPTMENYNWVADDKEVLNKFKKLVIVSENTLVGEDFECELYQRLKHKDIQVVDKQKYAKSKKFYKHFISNHTEECEDAIHKHLDMNVRGLITVDDCRFVRLSELKRIFTGINEIDGKLGGLVMGFTSLWTGKTGEGKTTLTGQLVLNAIEQGHRVCVYSGEMGKDVLFSNLCIQAVGKENIALEPIYNWQGKPTGEYESIALLEAEQRFRNWVRDKLYIYDNKQVENDEGEYILELFQRAYKMYNCTLFLVDNLMTVNTGRNDKDHQQMQADFVVKLVKMNEKIGTHTMLVAHPRKTQNSVTKTDDIAGLSTIGNIVGSIITVKKFDIEEQLKVNKQCEKDGQESYTGLIVCTKNRLTGKHFRIKTRYDSSTRRIVTFGDKQVRYSLNDSKYAMQEIDLHSDTWGFRS